MSLCPSKFHAMKTPLIPQNEHLRLKVLKGHSILDTEKEPEFDEITFVASQVSECPIAIISFIDEKRQWFKSVHGLDICEAPREVSFCAHAINETSGSFEVMDTLKDERFFDNPLVTGEPHVRFYSATVIKSKEGFPLGTLCVVSPKPSQLSAKQKQVLKVLGKQCERLLELKTYKKEVGLVHNNLMSQNAELERFAEVAAHDIKSPLNKILGLTNLLAKENENSDSLKSLKMIKMLASSSIELKKLVDGILEHSKFVNSLGGKPERIATGEFFKELVNLFDPELDLEFHLPEDEIRFNTDKVWLTQIFLNLITNSVKHSNENSIKVSIQMHLENSTVHFKVSDNGPGIPSDILMKIFQPFYKFSRNQEKSDLGNGLGLATVKRLVQNLGGNISAQNGINGGAVFKFSIPNAVAV